MAAKKLEIDSKYSHLDVDGDGVVSDEEMMREERMIELADKRSDMENEDKKQDAQRNMAWFALSGLGFAHFQAVCLELLPIRCGPSPTLFSLNLFRCIWIYHSKRKNQCVSKLASQPASQQASHRASEAAQPASQRAR